MGILVVPIATPLLRIERGARLAFRGLSMRVGALPEYPTNSLSYNLTWSTDGVINEYCEPCAVIANGHA